MTCQRTAHLPPNPRKTIDLEAFRAALGQRLGLADPIGQHAVAEIAELKRTAWRGFEDVRSKKVVPPGVVKLVCFVVALDELEKLEHEGGDVAAHVGLAPSAPLTVTALYDYLCAFWADWNPNADDGPVTP